MTYTTSQCSKMSNNIFRDFRYKLTQNINALISSRNRRIVFTVILTFCLLVYFLPSFFHSTKIVLGFSDCSDFLASIFSRHSWAEKRSHGNLIVHHGDEDRPDFTVVGNGKLLLSLSASQSLFLIANHDYMRISLNPLVNVQFVRQSVSTVIDTTTGVGTVASCYGPVAGGNRISVENTVIAHRTRPHLLAQKIRFSNTNSHNILLPLNIDESQLQFVTEQPKVTETFSSASNLVHFGAAMSKDSVTRETITDILNEAKEETKNVAGLTWDALLETHTNGWATLWKSNLNVGPSTEKNAPSASVMNATIYRVITVMESPLLEDISVQKKTDLIDILNYPETCFRGHPTVDAEALWRIPRSEVELFELVQLWTVTLEKHGCSKIPELGASGMMEAMMLSFASLTFTEHHLALTADPHFFHRDIGLRHVNLESCYISINISLHADSSAWVTVTAEECSTNLYVCGAGCLDKPQSLSSLAGVTIRVKVTTPLTALAYIAKSERHLIDLRVALHIRDIGDFTVGQVRHATQNWFWLAIALIVISFHVFLLVLVFKEWQNNRNYKVDLPAMDPLMVRKRKMHGWV